MIRSAILFWLLVLPRAYAYPTPVDFDGTLLRWNVTSDAPEITYEIESTESRDLAIFAPIIQQAALKWTSAPGSIVVLRRALDGETADITIHLQQQIEGGTYSAGYTVFDEMDDTDGPKHCSSYVLVDSELSIRATAKTILHELGHCLGLGHSLIPEAIMSYQLDKNAFALDSDDVAAVARLYPENGRTPSLPPGCSISQAHESEHSMLLSLLIISFPCLLAWGRRLGSLRT